MKTVFILISMLFPVAVMAQKSVKISDDISITQLSDKVYTYVSLAEIEGWGMVPSNGMIVINNHQAALLDTPINDAQTEMLVNWVTDSLHAKVTTFIPNHWHGDCIGRTGLPAKERCPIIREPDDDRPRQGKRVARTGTWIHRFTDRQLGRHASPMLLFRRRACDRQYRGLAADREYPFWRMYA